ncbi:MAG: ATP-dependent DNA ligase [Methylococcaceae bacterium]|jgi:DNA ligase-1
MKSFKPMLSATHDSTTPVSFPLLVSPKLDGIRCLIVDGQAVSRTLKPIANKALREILSNPALNHLDGELLAGSATSETAFNTTTRSVMTHEASTEGLVFHVFDYFLNPALPFFTRLEMAESHVLAAQSIGLPVAFVSHTLVHNEAELHQQYEHYLQKGFEGLMARSPTGPYKFGRSTVREGHLLKMKPWSDSDAEIIGFDELERNQNEAKKDELGHTKRSTAKDGKVAGDTLGALQVRDLHSGQVFSIGGGFTAADRDRLWSERDTLIGQVVKYKSVTIGVLDAPRFPVFLGFRDRSDLAA